MSTIIGPALPTTSGSLINNFSYKGFTLSVNIGFETGYYFVKPTLSYSALFYSGVGAAEFSKRWQKPGDEATTSVPAMVYTDYPQFSQRDQFYGNAAVNALKGDNVRIRYINLSYRPVSKSHFLHNADIFASLSNAGIIWRANKEGLDPDYPGTLAPLKSYSLGIRAAF